MDSRQISHDEALANVETWILAPGDFLDLLPDLAALKGSRDYSEQRRAISIMTGRSEDEIDIAVEGYVSRSMQSRAPGQKNYSHFSEQPYTSNQQGPVTVVHHYYNTYPADQNLSQCASCKQAMPTYQGKTQLKSGGCLLTFFLLIFFFPLFWVPLVFYREPKPELYCEKCRKLHHLP